MKIRPLTIPGCFEIEGIKSIDDRGFFFKSYNRLEFNKHGLFDEWKELFFSWSRPKVIRGFHFQGPPSEHTKLISCPVGLVLDVALDIRRSSPTFGKHQILELSEEIGNVLYYPPGIAHAFYVPHTPSLMQYAISSIHDSKHDLGIRWDSCGIDWNEIVDTPIISERDKRLPPWQEFQSPFN